MSYNKVRCNMLTNQRFVCREGIVMISRYEQFSFIISSLNRRIQKIERDEMIKYGYKGAYAQYLMALRCSPDGLTSGQLSDVCDKDKAAVSRVVAEMEQKGLVSRGAPTDSMYRAQIRLTDAGKEAAQVVAQRAVAAVQAAGKGLTEENRRVFYEVLALLSNNLQNLSEGGIPEEES